MTEFLMPDWPAPANIHAYSSTRGEGFSEPPFDSFNLASHVGDHEADVLRNRQQLFQQLNLPVEPLWLEQVHGIGVLEVATGNAACVGDAAFAQEASQVCAVMTADCLPVLFCDRQGQTVAAAHAGWRGLLAGVLESTLDAMACETEDILAWMGPAIGPDNFEVGEEVYQAFVQQSADSAAAFKAHRPGHYLADIYQLARLRLQSRGVNQIYGGDRCTFQEQDRFFSFRREGQTGRMVSLIWREP
ncbi:MAG: peptidoglycan editing factor PgeF [Gammaproteobacteria bacterium]